MEGKEAFSDRATEITLSKDVFLICGLPHSFTEDVVPRRSHSKRLPEIPTVGDFPEVGRELPLVCGSCGKRGKYAVGRVMVDPRRIRDLSKIDDPAFDEAVSYSGIFFCKHCGADGPWQAPMETRRALLALLSIPSEPGEWGVQFGLLQMFDGTIARTGAAAEAHLKQKLKEDPENAYLWGRLGNFYEHTGLFDLAQEAFGKSIELDPCEIESLYSLGFYRRDEGDWIGAAECFGDAIRHTRTSQKVSPQKLQKLVRSALESLFELHQESNGKIPFPPKLDLPVQAGRPRPEDLGLLDVDLPSEEGFEILTSLYLTGKVPEQIRRRAAKRGTRSQDEGGTIRQAQRPGRNDLCPCGSGKKYKRCCMSR